MTASFAVYFLYMQFNDTGTEKSGIIQECGRKTGLGVDAVADDPVLLVDFTNYINTTLRTLWFRIWNITGNWLYDDSNQTNLPQATADLVEDQRTYALPGGGYTILRAEFQNSGGVWQEITPLSMQRIPRAIPEFRKASGTPRYYRLTDDTLELFPASNYSKDASLKLYFDRGSVAFVSTDITQEPGFITEFHDLVPLGASIEWLTPNNPEHPSLGKYELKFEKKSKQLEEYYGKRFLDMEPTRITVRDALLGSI